MRLLLLSLLLVYGCKRTAPEFKQLNKEIAFKYHQFGEGNACKMGETIALNLMITKGKDTLHYVPDYPYFIQLSPGLIDSAFLQLKEGDSATFRLSRKLLNQRFKFYKLLQSDTGEVDLHLRFLHAYTAEEAEQAKMKALSKRELEEQAEFRDYLKKTTDQWIEEDGTYWTVLRKDAAGDSIRYGSEVSIHYRGSFLDGYVFDNTYEKGITPTFIYGKEYQMIEGMQIGLKKPQSG